VPTPNYPITTYPTPEATSALYFSDLILAVAKKIGTAYYGANGQGVAQIPVDAYSLDQAQDIVNKGIRMLISDGPQPNGWRWLNQIAQVDLFPECDFDPTTQTYVNITTNGTFSTLTLVTNTTGTTATRFTQSMELQNIWISGYPPPGTPGYYPDTTVTQTPIGTAYAVASYLSPTQVAVYGNATANGTLSQGFSIVNTGDYTLPTTFSGQYSGPISFIAGTNRGVSLHWVNEFEIRRRRQIYSVESGTPFEAAIRLIPQPTYNQITGNPTLVPNNRRRWQFMTWFACNEWLSVIFPFYLNFDTLVNLTDVPPSPITFDECLRAACMAVAEKDVEDTNEGPDWQYYRTICLPNAYRIDAMSVSKNIGRFSDPSIYMDNNGLRDWRDAAWVRPIVDVLGSAFTGG
jgi:hypothetical protein